MQNTLQIATARVTTQLINFNKNKDKSNKALRPSTKNNIAIFPSVDYGAPKNV